MTSRKSPAESDAPIPFQVFTEIAIIAHLADNAFAKTLPEGMTTAQFGVLNHLVRIGVAQTITEIASAMQVAQPTMSSTVKKLAEKNLVELRARDGDGRVREVMLTEKGRAMRKRGVTAAAPLQMQLAKEMPRQAWKRMLPELRRLRRLLDDNR